MPASTITADDITAAATALVAEGQSPTVRAVRARLGTGSMTTIANILRSWSASQQSPAASISADLPPAVLDAAAAMWAAARVETERRVSAVRAAADEEIRLACAERDAALTAQGEAIDEAEAARARADELSSQLDAERAAHAAAMAAEKRHTAFLDAQFAECSTRATKLEAELDRAVALAQTLQSALDTERAEHAAYVLAASDRHAASLSELAAQIVAGMNAAAPAAPAAPASPAALVKAKSRARPAQS